MTIYPDPFRLRIQKALTSILTEIAPTQRGRLYFGDNDPLSMISILEPPVPLEQLAAPLPSTSSSGDWNLLIQGWVKDDKKNPTDPAHQLMAQVKQRLSDENKRVLPGSRNTPDPLGMGQGQIINGQAVGNAVTKIIVGPGVVRPPEAAISDKACFWLNATLKIVEDISRPFE